MKKDGAHRFASAAHRALAALLAAVVRERGKAPEFGDCLARHRADLRHMRHQAGNRAPRHSLDLAECRLQGKPQRIGVDEGDHLVFQTPDLLVDGRQHGGEAFQCVWILHQAALVVLCGPQLDQLAHAHHECGETQLRVRPRRRTPMRLVSAYQAIIAVSILSVFSSAPMAWAN